MSRSTFEAATKAFHQALRTDDADALFMHVDDDVLLMPPGESAVRGKRGMQDWAVELGNYEWGLTPIAGGDPVLDRGNYMQLWNRQPDGQWRFAREIWNSSGPVS